MIKNVLSTFDGPSTTLLALQDAGIEIENYFASEIDKYAEAVSKYHFPQIKRLGDVTKWREWGLPQIDLLVGGSPCQGFSLAGKHLNFEDERSKLFFEFVDILKALKPKYFILENVNMKKEYQDRITEILGVEPILINSALVSAQNRQRLYWTNIPNIKQPEDRRILLKDIVFLDTRRVKHAEDMEACEMCEEPFCEEHNEHFYDCMCLGVNSEEYEEYLELVHTEKAINYMNRKVKDGRTHWDFMHHSDIRKPKSSSLVANLFKGVPYNVFIDREETRKFHPIECERLQTYPDNFTQYGIFDGKVKEISNTQRYKMCGNGFTKDVIAHLLKGLA